MTRVLLSCREAFFPSEDSSKRSSLYQFLNAGPLSRVEHVKLWVLELSNFYRRGAATARLSRSSDVAAVVVAAAQFFQLERQFQVDEVVEEEVVV